MSVRQTSERCGSAEAQVHFCRAKNVKRMHHHIYFSLSGNARGKNPSTYSQVYRRSCKYTTSSRHRPKLQYIFMQLRRIVVSTFNVSLLHNRPYFISKRLCAQRREVVTTEGRLSREYTLPGEFNLQPPKYQKS